MQEYGVYHHPPGHLSRWGVVDVGLKCMHSCKHCFYSFLNGEADQFVGMRHAKFHSLENLLALVDSLADHGFLGFDITGGEPCLHPKIVDVVARARERGIAPRIITLAQYLMRRMKSAPGHERLLDGLLDAGLVDFRFSLHSTEPAMFQRMTGGELPLMIAAMDELQRRGFQYITNTTITEENYRYLPEIARWIAARPEIYQTTFLFFMPYYEWSKAHAGEHRVRYSEIAGPLYEAVDIVEEAGIGCAIRYAPQCTIAGMEENHVGITGVRHDIHEWMNAIDHTADPEKVTLEDMRAMGRPIALKDHETNFPLRAVSGTVGEIAIVAQRGGGKVFPAKCRNCRAMAVCDGVDAAYLERHGDQELRPYAQYRGNPIDRARLQYKAGHVIKVSPLADAKSEVRAALIGMDAQ